MTMDTSDDTGLHGKKFLNVSEVARTLNISKKTVYAMCKRHYLPCFKVGSRVLIDAQDLQERLRELKQESGAEIS